MPLLERHDTTNNCKRRHVTKQTRNQTTAINHFVIEEAPGGTTIMTKKSILATLLHDEQSRAALEIVFSSSDDDDDFNFLGDADDDTILVPPPAQEQATKKRRTRFVRLCKTESNWWKMFLAPNPDGREDKKFRRLFRVPYFVFCERLLPLTISKWFPTWEPNQVDCWGQPVGDLELKLMGGFV
jgi:hypothetical protein